MRLWSQRQTLYDQYERLMTKLEVENPAAFKNFVKVEPAMFKELLNRLGPAISKKDTFYMKATGDGYHSPMYGFHVGHNTISCIVHKVY